MSVAFAEQLPTAYREPYLVALADESALPEVIFVPGLASEQFDRKRAERLMRTVGEVALNAVDIGQAKAEKQMFTSLFDALHAAKKGNQVALESVEMNVSTDQFERTKKVEFVMSVELEEDEQGEIAQHGQTNEQIQANTLYYCSGNRKMQPRYEAETRNNYRLGTGLRQGRLEDYWFVVFSPCPDDMTDEESSAEGFFSYTKSMAIQATSVVGDKIVMQSAFVAGVRDEVEERHDFAALEKLGNSLKIDLTGTAAEIIDKPILIPKIMMPNGVIDIVKLYDEFSGGTFFGMDKPGQDYNDFLAACEKERHEAKAQTAEMVSILLSRAHEAVDPISAVELLSDVVEEYMARVAVGDETIDARVFGIESAWYITDARAHMAVGDFDRAHRMTQRAVETARSSSCPGGAKKAKDLNSDGLEGIDQDDNMELEQNDETEDCDFVSKQCPMCHKKNVKTTVRSGVYYGECGCDSKHGKHASHSKESKNNERQNGSGIRELFRQKPNLNKKGFAARIGVATQ